MPQIHFPLGEVHPYAQINLGLPQASTVQANGDEKTIIARVYDFSLEQLESLEFEDGAHNLDLIPRICRGEIIFRKIGPEPPSEFASIISRMEEIARILKKNNEYARVPKPIIEYEELNKEAASSEIQSGQAFAKSNQEKALDRFTSALQCWNGPEPIEALRDFFLEYGSREEKELIYLYLAIYHYKHNELELAEKNLFQAQFANNSIGIQEVLGDLLRYEKKFDDALGQYQAIQRELTERTTLLFTIYCKILFCNPSIKENWDSLYQETETDLSKILVALTAYKYFFDQNEHETANEFFDLISESSHPLPFIVKLAIKEQANQLDNDEAIFLKRTAAKKFINRESFEDAIFYLESAISSTKENDEDYQNLITCNRELAHPRHQGFEVIKGEGQPQPKATNQDIAKVYSRWAKENETEHPQKTLKIYLDAIKEVDEITLRYELVTFILTTKDSEMNCELTKQLEWLVENYVEKGRRNEIEDFLSTILNLIKESEINEYYPYLVSEKIEVFNKLYPKMVSPLYLRWFTQYKEGKNYESALEVAEEGLENFPKVVELRAFVNDLAVEIGNPKTHKNEEEFKPIANVLKEKKEFITSNAEWLYKNLKKHKDEQELMQFLTNIYQVFCVPQLAYDLATLQCKEGKKMESCHTYFRAAIAAEEKKDNNLLLLCCNAIDSIGLEYGEFTDDQKTLYIQISRMAELQRQMEELKKGYGELKARQDLTLLERMKGWLPWRSSTPEPDQA